MYFLTTGTVAVQKEGKTLAHLKEGAFFGEVALTFPETKRTASIVAEGDCYLVVLRKAALDNAFQECVGSCELGHACCVAAAP